MNIEEKVYAVLSVAAGVIAFTTAARIKPIGDWQALDRPYIIHFPVTEENVHTHDKGLANLKLWRYQVSCIADSYSSAKALAVAVRDAFGSYRTGGIVSQYHGQSLSPYAPDERVVQINLDFEIADML